MQPEAPSSRWKAWCRDLWLKNFLSLFPYTFRTPRGYQITCRRRYEIRMCETIFGRRHYPVDRLPYAIRSVVDVGANIGVFSLFCADAFADRIDKIYSIEPYLPNYRRICSTVSRNGLDKVIVPIHRAVSDQEGTVDLLLGDAHYSHSLLPQKVTHPRARQPVAMTTLNALKRELGLTELDLLKVDIEGAELKAFAQGHELLAVTNMLIVEVHEGFCSFQDVLGVLRPFGFQALQSPKNENEIYGDFCFYRAI